ncbi:MAG: heavy metal-associated domain-containing protein [Flavobacteriales bacterium]
MKIESIAIANLSCGGCVNTITKKLTKLSGVENVKVDLESSVVEVEINEETERENITNLLLSIGYPEATEKNGLLTQIKSVTSCLTGRMIH